MFIYETPNRWWPVERHTTGLPLINYMPDSIAHFLIRWLSPKLGREVTWMDCLQRGIRGGSVHELVHIIRRSSGTVPLVLQPHEAGFTNRIDLCWGGPGAGRGRARRLGLLLLKAIKATVGLCLVPDLELAIQKQADS